MKIILILSNPERIIYRIKYYNPSKMSKIIIFTIKSFSCNNSIFIFRHEFKEIGYNVCWSSREYFSNLTKDLINFIN